MLGRGLRRLWAELPFVVVVLTVVVATVYLYLAPGHWRKATLLISAALLVAGILRTALPTSRVGMLAIRARWWDVVCYYALGGLILAVDIRLH